MKINLFGKINIKMIKTACKIVRFDKISSEIVSKFVFAQNFHFALGLAESVIKDAIQKLNKKRTKKIQNFFTRSNISVENQPRFNFSSAEFPKN